MSTRHTFAAAVIAAAAVLTGALGLVAGGTPPARAASGAVVLDEGAVDLTPRLVDGKLQLQLDDRTTGTAVVREPSEVVWHVVPEAKSFVEGPLQGPLGSLMDAWYLNGWEADQIFALEPGWNGTEAGADTEVTLTGFEGPGGFALYDWLEDDSYDDIPPDVHLASDPAANTSYALGKDAEHAVPTWGFGAEGVYRLTIGASTTLADGTVSSDTETLAVAVGNVNPTAVLPGDGSTPTAGPPATETVTPTPTASSPGAHVIDDGHLDLAARPVDGGLEFQIKEGTAYDYEWYEPDEVVLYVVPAAKKKITSGTAFLGAEGDPVWWLPLAQVSGILWPGWSTEEWEPSALDGKVTYQVDSLQGPGSLAIFSGGSLSGWDLWINSGDGLPDSFRHSVDAHSHSYWAFTQEGVYRTEFTVSATLADGTKATDTETIAWVVGDDVDPSTVEPGAGDEATATPTASASASASPSGTASSNPEVSSSPAESTPAVRPSGGTSATVTGVLASTGSGVLEPLGASVAALLVGCGAVWAVRRRRVQQ